jgi:hypothetical protein
LLQIRPEEAARGEGAKLMTNVRTPSTTTPLRWVLGLTSTAYFMVVLDSLVVITA